MNKIEEFNTERKAQINEMIQDSYLKDLSHKWLTESCKYKYSYNFTWLGRPIIQYPQDIMAMQEIIWKVKPDVIIETGIAHGGSLIFYASMLELIGKGKVLGIDIDIRSHNKSEIEKHPLSKRITMIEGSSLSDGVLGEVKSYISDNQSVLVCLDSYHTYDHVLCELKYYSQFVTKDSYLVVFDTVIEDLPEPNDRPWGKHNNPKMAVKEFIKRNNRFIIDDEIENKLLISVSPSGYLKCIKEP